MFRRLCVVLALALAANAFTPLPLRTLAPRTAGADIDRAPRSIAVMGGKERELRDRIESVGNTRKITEAMRLVAAAKVRRAQQGEITWKHSVRACLCAF